MWVLFLLGTLPTAVAGRVFYVDADAAGAGDGSSWANAFNYLQDALITASAEDEIRVAEGTYKPNQGLIPWPGRVSRTPDKFGRSATFRLRTGLILKGGFAGFGALDPNERNSDIYKTILSGDLDDNDVDLNEPHDLADEPTRAENSHNVLTIFEDDSNIVLDGLIVTSATTGGLAIISSSSSISNCVFMNNSNDDDGGGAIVNINGSTFLTNCKFVNNFAVEHGGAIFSDYGNDVFVECSFVENSALDGTGIVNIEGNLELESCTFSRNSTYSSSNTNEEGGGAIYIVSKKVVVKNCLFNENVARYGGAMVGIADELTLERCVFISNIAEYGGAIYDLRGGTVTNSIFAGNRADEGGAVCGRYFGPSLINCTLSGNSAQNGNAISWLYCLDSSSFTMSITNCISRNGSDEIGRRNDKLPDITITYSNIQGGWSGEGNIDIDPLFADSENNDFHLKSQAGRWEPNIQSWVQDDVTSPCIDAGDPNSPVAFEPFPNGGIINMGAYGGSSQASMSTSGLHAKYGGGSGTADDPYLIYTAEQMNAVGAEPNDWDKHFKLMVDIDLSDYTGTDFNIIGNGLLPAFSGVFDGNGHTISNFTYSSTGETCIGIFGYVLGPNARIINVGMIDPNVNDVTAVGVGSLAGWIDMGTVTNCYVSGGSVMGRQQVGGLIGSGAIITDCYAVRIHVIAEGSAGGLVGSSSGSIINCYATGDITGSYRIGGLVGSNHGAIVDSYSGGSVAGGSTVGGLVGYNYDGSISNCFSTTNITGKNSIGGLVGENDGTVLDCYCSCTLEAQDQVGGLVGINGGIITASYSSANVQGRDEVGGLVGFNSYNGEIVNCYANGDAAGQNYVGGLVGKNATVVPRAGDVLFGSIRNCYSATLVSGDNNIGGLVGYYGGEGVSSSFWDIEASGQTTGGGGIGKTTTEMQDPNTFISAGWDFVGTAGGPGDIWAEPEGGGYPVLLWQLSPPPELPAFSGGTGGPDDPYLVSTADELNSIGHNPRLMTANFKLVNDIDLTGVDFYALANQYYQFCGTFDGDGHTISNFSYRSAEAAGAGLFEYVLGGQIMNLGLVNPDVHVDRGNAHGCLVGLLRAGIVTDCYVESGSITGQNELGGLVGENDSSGLITNCHFAGEAAGSENVGGLVGQNSGSIAASYSYADIEGRTAVGGLVGRCAPGEIVNCYARGSVAGQWYVGGLVGSNGSGSHNPHGRTGTIRNCYSASASLEGSQKGGLLGADWGGAVENCFWDIETSGLATSYGGEGKTTAEMQTAGTFLNAGWDFIGETTNGTEDIWWILEGQDYPHLWWESVEDGE